MKKNHADFIDEEEFLSAVSMNKKGGCVRMGKSQQEAAPSSRPSEQNTQGTPLGKLKVGSENLQRKPAYIRLDNHNRFTVAAGVYKVTLGQIVDSVLDEWWEKNRDEVKSLYDRDRDVFDNN